MRTVWIATLLLLWAESARADPDRLFPERPSLDALAPRGPVVFTQETWNGRQHCWEWGVASSEEGAVRRELRTAARAAGISGDPTSGVLREGGNVVAIAPGTLLDTIDPGSAVFKLVVCTEGVADVAQRDRFFASIRSDRLFARLPFGPFDLAWRRRYANGAIAIGLRFPNVDEGSLARAFVRRGYTEVERRPGIVEMRRGLARARLMGGSLWWQAQDRSERR